jgi:hypothetical protein
MANQNFDIFGHGIKLAQLAVALGGAVATVKTSSPSNQQVFHFTISDF